MSSFSYFLISSALAGLSVGESTGNVQWGCSTVIILIAIRNAIVAGYVDGRKIVEGKTE